MTTTVTSTIRNGVDSVTMYATLDAIKAQPELAKFQFRACGVPEVGPGSLTSGDRGLGMIPTCRCGCCI